MKVFLFETNPELIDEWDYTKNKNLTPYNTTRGQTKEVWWICKQCGHEWHAKISDRAIKKSKCPRGYKTVTQQEIRVFCELKTIIPDLIQQYPFKNFKLDMYSPSINLVIEVDGYLGHSKSFDRDVVKNTEIQNAGFNIFHLRQNNLKQILSTDVFYKQITIDVIKTLVKNIYNLKPTIEIQQYLNNISFINELEYQTLCKEWHQLPFSRSLASLNITNIIPIDENNNPYNQRNIFKKSHLNYNWKCLTCNETWTNKVCNQTKSMNCPFCTKQKVSWFYNLALVFPEIIKNWDYAQNKIPPEQYLPFASDDVWWICEKCKLSWKASIAQRTSSDTGCSFCNSKKATPTNNLAFLYPELMKQWDFLKNTTLPSEYLPNSNKYVYWLCPICLHSWGAKIQDRTTGKRCPVESGQIVTDFNCLSKTNPKLAQEWHPENTLKVNEVTYGCKQKVLWVCSNCKKEYPAGILNRSKKGSGCECGFRIAPEFINNSYFHK